MMQNRLEPPERPLTEQEPDEIGECEGSGCEIYKGQAYWVGDEGMVCDREDCARNFLESMMDCGKLSALYIMEMLGYRRVTPDV